MRRAEAGDSTLNFARKHSGRAGRSLEANLRSAETVPSPIATGGGGERFEQRVDAFALALLLARSTAPVILDCLVVEVHLQIRHVGWRTDDLLIVGERAPGVTRRLAIQVKRTFTVSAADEECVKTISAMWDDFVAHERFDPELDRLAVVTLHGTSTLLVSFASLLDCARAASGAEDFRHRAEAYLGQKAKSQDQALRSILREHVQGEIDEELYWRFLRIVNVLSLDLGTSTSTTEANVLSLLAHLAADAGDPSAAARATWERLLEVAGEGRESARSFTREALPELLRQRHHVVEMADERALRELTGHGEVVRRSIRATLAPGFRFERGAEVSALLEQLEEHGTVLVSGPAGAGKSALAKTLLERVQTERPVLAFQAVEFATAHLDDTLARARAPLSAWALVSLLAAHDRIVILIDGVERLLEHSVRDAFAQLLQVAAETPALRLLLTCRDYSAETVRSALLAPVGLAHAVIDVGPVSDQELEQLAEAVPSLGPLLRDARMRSFLRTPYVLDMASRMDWTDGGLPENERAFRDRCWRELVRDDAHAAAGMPRRREDAFLDIARRRAAELRPYVAVSKAADVEALDGLRRSSLVVCSPESDRLFAPAHDVLEDWGILHWLDEVAASEDDPAAALHDAVAGLPAMRRALRRWLGERLETDAAATREFIRAVAERTDLSPYFRDDCVVAALLSDFAADFLGGLRERIAGGDTAVLRHVLHLLRVACKTTPSWLKRGGLPSILLVPAGPAWAPALELVASNLPTSSSDALIVLGVLEDWARQMNIALPAAPGADAAGRIVSALLPLLQGYRLDDARKRALAVLIQIPAQAPAFRELCERTQAGDRKEPFVREFVEKILSLSSAFACRDVPDLVIGVVRACVMMSEADAHSFRGHPLDVDECFGIKEVGVNDCFPASALQGPFGALIRYHPGDAVAFLLDLFNHAGDWYGLRRWPGHDLEEAVRITLEVPGRGPVEQWMNGRLYGLFRGMTVGPYTLQSALMALENWLLQMAVYDWFDLETWLLHILAQSNNVMATGVVASVAIAHPERAGRAALALLSSRELIQLDLSRKAAESTRSLEFLPDLDQSNEIYHRERRTSNALPHRREDLEALAVRLQLSPLREAVWEIIDRHRRALPDDTSEDTLVWRLALHRMDVRGYRPVDTPTAGLEGDAGEGAKLVYYGPGEVEPELKTLVDASAGRMAVFERHLRLRHAAETAWRDRRSAEAAEWRTLLADARALAEEGESPESHLRGGVGIAAAVCVRDHLADLEADELTWCAARVVNELRAEPDDLQRHSRMFGPDRAAAAVAGLLVTRVPDAVGPDPLELLVHALTHPTDEVADYGYSGVGGFVAREDIDMALKCAGAAARAAEEREAEIREGERRWDEFGIEPDARAPERVRPAVREVVEGPVGPARELVERLDLAGWGARHAAERICWILGDRTDAAESRAFYGRVARWLAETWSRGRAGGGDHRDFAAEQSLSTLVAKYALKLPAAEARELCAPLADVVASEPGDIEMFVQDLILAADGGANDSFWPLWQDLADHAVGAPWAELMNDERPRGARLVERLFLAISWKEDAKHWERLNGESHRVHSLAQRLPATPTGVEAYARFLYTIGQQSLPEAFTVLDAMMQRGDAVRIAGRSNTAFYLESLLGRFVYGQPHRLKADAALRGAVLRLLDALVLAGSPAAYRMRDDFVTPLPPAEAA